MTITVPGVTAPLDSPQALRVCQWYDETHPDTLKLYDFAGTATAPHASDTVDLSHAGRLVVINARLEADDVPKMIAAAATAPWEAVTHKDNIETTDDLAGLLERAELLYLHFRDEHRLGPTRTHKLLHLVRPHVIPIVDSVVRTLYAERARHEAERRSDGKPAFWPPLAHDIRTNADGYAAVRNLAGGHPISRLTSPRLHDILVWSLNGREQADARALL